MHYKLPDPYAPGREAFKRYVLTRAYCQSDVNATSELISTLQAEFTNRAPLPPVPHPFNSSGKKDF